MIVLNLMLDGIYGFNDFTINFTYPKKIVNSIVERENLAGRGLWKGRIWKEEKDSAIKKR